MPYLNELRFVMKDNKRILQQYVYDFSMSYQDEYGNRKQAGRWQDVPLVEEVELSPTPVEGEGGAK